MPLHLISAVLLALSAFAFGAVHAWALYPLLGFSLVGGVVLARTSRTPALPHGYLLLLVLPLGAAALQLVPLPASLLDAVSPSSAALSAAYRVFPAPGSSQPVSVAPRFTAICLITLVSLGAFACGAMRALHQPGEPARVSRNIAAIGVLLSVFALIQAATFNRKIFWVWESRFGSWNNYFGPFVNRNHFAGWMLLASSLTAGFLVGQVAAARRRPKRRDWRERLLWFSTDEASGVILAASALVVMLVATAWSMSRSGMAGTVTALAVVAVTAAVRLRRGAERVTVLVIVLAIVLAAGWRGVDRLAEWYGTTWTFEWRLTLWRDTWPALKAFWLTGSGLNTYGVVMLFFPQTDTRVHAQQAHNDYLQLAVEGGLLVTLPLLIAAIGIGRLVRTRLQQPQDELTWWIRLGAIAGICGMAVQETVEFSLQIPAVSLLFTTLLAIAAHEPAPLLHRRTRRLEPQSPRERVGTEVTMPGAGLLPRRPESDV